MGDNLDHGGADALNSECSKLYQWRLHYAKVLTDGKDATVFNLQLRISF